MGVQDSVRDFGITDVLDPETIRREMNVVPFVREEGRHYHTFRLPEPNGPTSLGVCSCGATKECRNVFAGDVGNPLDVKRWNGRQPK